MFAYFNTMTPNFAEYLVDDKGDYHVDGNSYEITVLADFFFVRAVNQLGRGGVMSYIDFSR